MVSLSATEAAAFLCSELGGDSTYWVTWLANDRRPNRVNRCLPVTIQAGKPRYSATMVEAYIAECKKNYTSLFPNARHVGLTAGKLLPHISVLNPSNEIEIATVLFVINKPMASFKLTAKEAKHIAAQLIKAAQEIEKNN